ncbi:MAG TPA: hypothetical protein VGG62_12150 [Terracidiphilus sp.]|jgi:hypothetical protein
MALTEKEHHFLIWIAIASWFLTTAYCTWTLAHVVFTLERRVIALEDRR